MGEQATFSVIVPIYKVENYLRECIDSILGQTFGDFELILIDDGSPDNCPAICDEYARQDDRIRVIHQENGGIVRARETGILAATGKYVCWVDGDDFVSTELLEHLLQIMQEHDGLDMICYDFSCYYDDREPHFKPHSENNNHPVPGMYDKRRLEREIYPYMIMDSRKSFFSELLQGFVWCKCFKRELIAAHYCKEPRIRQGDDAAFVYECLFFADTVFCSDKVLYYYRQRGDSIMHDYDGIYLDRAQVKIHYLRANTGILSECLAQQIENLYVADLLLAVIHFAQHQVPLFEARRKVKEMIRRTGVMDDIRMGKTIPLYIRIAVLMLRCHFYLTALIAARFMVALIS